MSKALSILLPTYNEANNVAPLLRGIAHAMEGKKVDYEIIFVDDSTDMTPDIIKRMQEVYPEVRLIHRPVGARTGLATALVEGFQQAEGEYILCMDSDLQHPTQTIPELFQVIVKEKADVVVATRYLAGGSAEGLQGNYRKLVSHLCRLAAWFFVPQTRKTTDPGSGFFVFRKTLVERMDFKGLQGFKILIDLLARTNGLKVAEVPFTFVKRENDMSKATLEQGVAFLKHLFHLKWQAWFRIRPSKTLESALPPKPVKRDWKGLSWRVALDLLGVAFLAGVGWYLIGYYAMFNFLYTGYEDWIYHAFRVKSLQEYGMVPWDHVWSNGINYWKLYQYVAHYLMYGVVVLTGLPVTKVLLLSLVTIYIGLRVVLYAILRFLGVSRLWALLATLASYTIVQEWGSMQDYSIYIAFIFFPLYILLWIKTFRDLRWIYVLAAVTGMLWIFHPVLGFNASILLGFLALFSRLKSDFSKIFRVGIVYLFGALPFLISYFTAGYFFTNPLFKSYIYLSTSVLDHYKGLSMLYWILFGVSWILVLWRSQLIPTWTKVLLGYASFYLVLVYLGQQDYLPQFLVQFQFSRGLTAVALALVLVFGAVFEHALRRSRSLGLTIVATVFIATSVVHAVDIASREYVSPPVEKIENLVATYFEGKPLPKGSVFTDNVSEATYFAPEGIRYATSYNEHMQPHPYSTRLRVLMHSRLGYTGISKSHIKNIENYATVLGIEYLFLQASSPLVKGLTEKEESQFVIESTMESDPIKDAIVVLRNTLPILSAFVIERQVVPEYLLSEELPLPTLHVGSYKVWDDRIAEMASIMRSDKVRPLVVEFIPTNKLVLTQNGSDSFETIEHPLVFVQQSYNSNWGVTSSTSQLAIQPTSLRLMVLEADGTLPAFFSATLENTWPRWHWPAQSIGLATVIVVLVWTLQVNGITQRWFKRFTHYVSSRLA